MDIALLARKLALTLVPMILSLSVHEFAHAWSAHRLGDPTAKDAGRLTLNPMAHIDIWGTLIIPTMSVLAGGVAFIGWARPTPCNPSRFHKSVNRRFGSALVSAAGPISNVVLALLSLGLIAILMRAHVPLVRDIAGREELTPLGVLAYQMFVLNIGLALFNLLPIPPLDGSRLLPPVFDPIVRPLERFGFAVLLLVFMFLPGVADTVFYKPFAFVVARLQDLFGV